MLPYDFQSFFTYDLTEGQFVEFEAEYLMKGSVLGWVSCFFFPKLWKQKLMSIWPLLTYKNKENIWLYKSSLVMLVGRAYLDKYDEIILLFKKI